MEEGESDPPTQEGNRRGDDARVVGELPPPPEGGKRRGEEARVGEELEREEDSPSRSSAYDRRSS